MLRRVFETVNYAGQYPNSKKNVIPPFPGAKPPGQMAIAIWPAQGIEAVSFFTAGKKDTSG
jgi:hypothetical protein